MIVKRIKSGQKTAIHFAAAIDAAGLVTKWVSDEALAVQVEGAQADQVAAYLEGRENFGRIEFLKPDGTPGRLPVEAAVGVGAAEPNPEADGKEIARLRADLDAERGEHAKTRAAHDKVSAEVLSHDEKGAAKDAKRLKADNAALVEANKKLKADADRLAGEVLSHEERARAVPPPAAQASAPGPVGGVKA